MHLVSIIVPIFNSEKYIDKCISSIISQTYTNWKLILVDDGSTDSSLALCKSYAEKDGRIIILEKKNTGVSDSRNMGLDRAVGEFVMFVDSDDYWLDDAVLERLVTVAVMNDLDIVRGEYIANDENDNLLYVSSFNTHRMQYAGKTLDSSSFIINVLYGEFFLWLYLIKRQAIGNLRFDSNRIFLEDMRFLSQLMMNHLRCRYISSPAFYAYRKGYESISSRKDARKLQDSFSMCDFLYELSLQTNDASLKRYFHDCSISMYYYTLDTMSNDEYYSDRRKHIAEFSLDNSRRKLASRVKGEKSIFKLLIYKVSPIWGIELLKLRHKLGSIKRILKS